MKLNEYIGKQIRINREKRNISVEQLAEMLGTTRATVTRYELGTRKANQDVLFKLAELFKISVDDFFPPRKHQSAPSNIIYPEGLERVQIPLVGEIACGTPITAEENIDGYIEETFEKPVPSGTLFGLRCKGHSMEPTIPDKAIVVIREQPDVEDDEIAAVQVDHDTEATLKRVKHQGDMILLMPDNKEYDPIILNKDNPGRIIGKAIKFSAPL